jgi:predicted RNase H-like HicB family nuclease
VPARAWPLDYWIDYGRYVGKLREIPGVFSQEETFEELKLSIKDAFALMSQEMPAIPVQNFHSAELQMEEIVGWVENPALY